MHSFPVVRLLSLAAIILAALPSLGRAQTQDIVHTAVNDGRFDILAQALTTAGLVETLKGDGPFTVFAPTDEAFRKLPKGTLEYLLKERNRDKLIALLTYHVAEGRILAAEALEAGHAKTLQGGKVYIKTKRGVPFVNKSRLIQTDVPATNGVIHVIDRVLMPKDGIRKLDKYRLRKAAYTAYVKAYYFDKLLRKYGYTERHALKASCTRLYRATKALLYASYGHGDLHQSYDECMKQHAAVERHIASSKYRRWLQHRFADCHKALEHLETRAQ